VARKLRQQPFRVRVRVRVSVRVRVGIRVWVRMRFRVRVRFRLRVWLRVRITLGLGLLVEPLGRPIYSSLSFIVHRQNNNTDKDKD
jgi:hypothetical protein